MISYFYERWLQSIKTDSALETLIKLFTASYKFWPEKLKFYTKIVLHTPDMQGFPTFYNFGYGCTVEHVPMSSL